MCHINKYINTSHHHHHHHQRCGTPIPTSDTHVNVPDAGGVPRAASGGAVHFVCRLGWAVAASLPLVTTIRRGDCSNGDDCTSWQGVRGGVILLGWCTTQRQRIYLHSHRSVQSCIHSSVSTLPTLWQKANLCQLSLNLQPRRKHGAQVDHGHTPISQS